MADIKIRIKNPIHSELVQKMLFALSYSWRAGEKTQHTNAHSISTAYMALMWGSDEHFESNRRKEVDFDWLLPMTHALEREGKTTYFSTEDFNIIREQLGIGKSNPFPPFKIRVDNPIHSEDIQKMLFAIGYKWSIGEVLYTEMPYLYCDSMGYITFSDGNSGNYFEEKRHPEVDFSWLLSATKTKTITIDGKDIELSSESYENLKTQLGG